MNDNKPIDQIRIGNLQAAIWLNQSEEGRPFFNTTISRRYRDQEGNWHTNTSFNHRDLLGLAKLADMAHSRVIQLQQEGGAQ